MAKKIVVFGLFNNNRIRNLTMLRVELSPLNAHKKAHNFPNDEFCLVCGCVEDTEHYLLACKSFILSRATMFNDIHTFTTKNISSLPKRKVVSTLLYGSEGMSYSQNTYILKAVSRFIEQSKRLEIII